MSEVKRPTRVRKQTVTDSARKRRRQRAVSKYNRSRIGIGQHIDRWMDLKSTLKLQTHADVAAYIISYNLTGETLNC